MKTLIDVKKEISDLIEEANLLGYNKEPGYKGKVTRIKTKIKMLRLAENYLLSDHNPAYVNDGLLVAKKRLENILNLTPSDLDRSSTNKFMKDKIKAWDKAEGVEKLRGQIKFLTYLKS